MITTICYGKADHWKSRKEAIEFFLDCMRNSEGAERDRYTSIYFDLLDGKNVCTDEHRFG